MFARCLVQSARNRASSACFSWSSRFCTKVRCCMTAFATWLFRKSIPRSIPPPQMFLVRRGEAWGAEHGPAGLAAPLLRLDLAVDHPAAEREEVGIQAEPELSGDLLNAVQELAAQA